MSQRANDLEGEVVLVERNGKFFFFQPDIGVIASDQGLEGAYGRFLAARRDFLAEVAQAGLASGSAATVAAASRGAAGSGAVAAPGGRGMAAELALFFAKLCIAVALVGGLATVLGARAASSITSALEQVKATRPLSFGDVVDKAADIARDIQSLTKEEKETLVRSVGTISRELDPIVDAWRNPPAR